MTPTEFENYLVSLNDDEYDALVQERISRLNAEQQVIVQAREVQKKERAKIFTKLADPNTTEDVHEMAHNSLRDMEYAMNCEHDRHICKHCYACGLIDHLMFPEIYDEDGLRLNEEE